MHDDGTPEWREIVNRSCASLIEQLAVAVDSERRRAIDMAIKTERESAQAALKTERESAQAVLKAERESAQAVLKTERETAEAAVRDMRDAARAELEKARESSQLAARQSLAEALNQGLRRIRQRSSAGAVLQDLAELTTPHAHKAVVLVFENNQARVAATRGLPASAPMASNGGDPAALAVSLEDAPALTSAIESRDPVTVLARESEVSSALVHLLSAGPSEKLYLFPVTARHQVVAMLVATGEVFAPGLELLAEAAGMRLESITAPATRSGTESLVNIERAAMPASAAPDRRSWDDLTAEDQQLHLQAQRMARVRVAKMRLDREDAWRRGLAQSDVYSALRRDIESARTEFLQTFLSRSSTMVDYLHLEILRTLANNDDRVLGHEYPGPMV